MFKFTFVFVLCGLDRVAHNDAQAFQLVAGEFVLWMFANTKVPSRLKNNAATTITIKGETPSAPIATKNDVISISPATQFRRRWPKRRSC